MFRFSAIKATAFVAIFFLNFGFVSQKIQKKVIRNSEFDIHFYVSLKEKNASKDRMYYWYKSGEIHNSFGAAGGLLLHDQYLRYYLDNQLAEKGDFANGLKNGAWKLWYSNGELKEELQWQKGKENGYYKMFSPNGQLLLSGIYKNGLKNSLWINHANKDTLWYKKGKEYREDPKILKKREDSIAGKRTLFQRIFRKADTLKVKPKTRTHKDKLPFYKRIFQKKDKSKMKN